MPRVTLTTALEICGQDIPPNVARELVDHDHELEDTIAIYSSHIRKDTYPHLCGYLHSEQLVGPYSVVLISYRSEK